MPTGGTGHARAMPDDRPHDDLHDRGLAFDLLTLQARLVPRVDRRQALRLLAGAGAGVVLVACGSDGGDSAATSSSTSTTGATSTTAAAGGGSVAAVPEETGGPYPGDGSNGPNVLVESGIVRQDIRSSFGDLSGTAEGVPLNLALQIVDASSGAPLEGAALYAWHCTREGGYSLYSDGVTNQNFLRGVQVADADGNLSFTTIYPGAYSGRWPHIHFEVYQDVDTATAAGSPIITSQIALPEGASREAYLTDGYEQSVDNLGSSSIESDMVFSDGYETQMATVDGDPTRGYTATLLVGV
jgi:protocatechuate 3,4-dioxygenase beta subunit